MSDQYGSTPQVSVWNALPPGYDKPKKLCSMVPWDLYVSHYTGQGVLPGAKGDVPGFLMVQPGEDRKDFGNNNYAVVRCYTGNTMALDIMGLDPKFVDEKTNTPREGKTSSWWEMGVFVPVGDEPTPAEIKAAQARLHAWARKQVELGDMEYGSRKNAALVPSLAKKAAQILRIEREWMLGTVEGSQMIDCPCCQNRIKPKAKKCSHCNELIGYDKEGHAYWATAPKPA